jgi:hypothetical protein
MKMFSGNQSRGRTRVGTPGQPHPRYLNSYVKLHEKSWKCSAATAGHEMTNQGSLILVTWKYLVRKNYTKNHDNFQRQTVTRRNKQTSAASTLYRSVTFVKNKKGNYYSSTVTRPDTWWHTGTREPVFHYKNIYLRTELKSLIWLAKTPLINLKQYLQIFQSKYIINLLFQYPVPSFEQVFLT